MNIAFIGIGLMGKPMAAHLLAHYPSLTLWNRTPSKAHALVEQGATLADSPAKAVKNADIIITMLENGPVTEQIMLKEGTLSAIKPGALWIDMASIPPEMAKAHAASARAAGIEYLDAPVSGGTVGAEQATLSIMAGGTESAFARAQPLFQLLGKKATYIGPAGSGQLAKCANQAIVGITIGAVSEALLLAAQGGANPDAVREALLDGFASSRILELHGQRMLDRAFKPGATSRVQLKDLQTILDTAAQSQLSLPLTETVFGQYQALVERGLSQVDHSGLLLELEHLNTPAKLNHKPTQLPETED